MAKKFLSLILTLSMVASLFAGMTFNVSAVTAYATENLDGVTVNHYINADAIPNGTHAAEVKALVTAGSKLVNDTTRLDAQQYIFGKTQVNEKTGVVSDGPAGFSDKVQTMVNSPYGSTDIAYGFSDSNSGTRLVHGRDDGGYYTIDASAADKVKTYRDVENTDDNFIHKAYFEFNIGKGATITDIIIGSASGGLRTGYYTVLTSDNGKDWTKHYAYACDRKVDGTNAVNSGIQHIQFAAPVKASYVRVEVYAHINSFQPANACSQSTIRMKCLQVYGTKANYVYSANGEADINNHSSDGSAYISNTLVPKYNELLGAQNSLIAGKRSAGVKYFISEEGAKNTVFDKGDGTLDSGFVYGTATAATPVDANITNGTTGIFNTDTQVVANASLKQMFFTNVATSSTNVQAKDLINDESKQWLQIDYALDAQTEISKFALMGKANQAWSPYHYKYYVADTRDGLYEEANCVAEIHKGSRLATVAFDTPVVGKYVGLRLICPYNPETANGAFTTPSGMKIRLTEFEVFGEYANPITATVTNATAEGATTTPTATFSYVGNVDDNSNYGAATVALSTEITVTDAGKVYDFKGWYLGEELISTAPSYIYNVRPSDAATLNFVAKYGVRLYNMTGVNKVGDATPENGFNVEPKNSLLAGAKVQSVYYLNTDLNDDEKLRAMQPTKLADDMLPPQIGRFTSVAETASDVMIFNVGNTTAPGPAKALAEAMFVQHDGTKVTALDAPDETKQWVQVNFKLPAEASITDVILSYNKMTSDTIARWTPSSYVYILANSEEDLLNGNGTRLEVNYTADTIKNITKLDLTEATTAKYIGIRFLQLYNDFNPAGGSNIMSGNFTLNLGLYARVTHFDVHGQYLTTATNDITAKAVDAEGAEVAIDATATATGVGGYDNNGNYVSKNVALAAEETKVIGDYEYTFAGWYKNDEADAVLATATGNVTVTDAEAVQFTAKYTATKLYTVKYMDGETEIASFQIEEGQTLAEIPAVPVKEGYTSAWDLDLTGVAIDGDKTVNAVHTIKTYTVTYVADGVTVDTQTVEHGSDATAPEAPAKEGYTFVEWDNDGKAIKANTTITATYEINTYTVIFKADDKVLKTETVEYGAAATAPEAPAKLGYTFAGWDVAFDNVVADIEVNAVYNFAGYVVTFESAAGVVLGEVVVADGQVPDINEVKAINEKVANIYGYEIAVNDAGDVIWDDDVYGKAIVANMTVRPFYEAKDISTAVTIYKLDNKTEYEKQGTQKYDTAIELVCEGANSWVDENGNVLLDTAEGTLYACGSTMKLYPVSEQKTAPAVAVVGKVNDGNYSVFAHVNVENATAYGVVFSSSTGFDQKNDFTVEDVIADTTGKRYKMVEIDATKVGQVDFMATLTGTGDKTRYARAYVVVGGQYIYSDVIRNK